MQLNGGQLKAFRWNGVIMVTSSNRAHVQSIGFVNRSV